MVMQRQQEWDSGGSASTATPHVRVAIVGAGFSGLGLAIRLTLRRALWLGPAPDCAMRRFAMPLCAGNRRL